VFFPLGNGVNGVNGYGTSIYTPTNAMICTSIGCDVNGLSSINGFVYDAPQRMCRGDGWHDLYVEPGLMRVLNRCIGYSYRGVRYS
jgi:hypothetical protein